MLEANCMSTRHEIPLRWGAVVFERIFMYRFYGRLGAILELPEAVLRPSWAPHKATFETNSVSTRHERPLWGSGCIRMHVCKLMCRFKYMFYKVFMLLKQTM